MAKTIVHPIGGIDRQFAFQAQPPFTCADAENVRSLGSGTGRARGGSRPGLVAAYVDQLGSDPITAVISSAVYDSETGLTRITVATPTFTSLMVGMVLTCTAPGTDLSYTIAEFIDSTNVDVTGDAIGARTVLLAGGTWPAWAAEGVLTVGGSDYEVATRVGDTEIRVTDDVPDATAASYSLVATYDTGTVQVAVLDGVTATFSGGASIPTWVDSTSVITIGGTDYDVASRDGVAQISLDAPGAVGGIPAGTAYSITNTYDTGNVTSGAMTIPYGSRINMLASVRPAAGSSYGSVVDDFEAQAPATPLIYSPWASAISGLFVSGNYLTVKELSGRRYADANTWDVTLGQYAGSAVAALVSDIDVSKPYTLTLKTGGAVGLASAGTLSYGIFLRMDDTTPIKGNSVLVAAFRDDSLPDTWDFQVFKYVSGVETSLLSTTRITLGYYAKATIQASVSSNSLSIYLDGRLVASGITMPAAAGTRFGVSIRHGEATEARLPLIDEVMLEYSQTTASLDYSKSKLCAAAAGTLYAESNSGSMVAVTGDVDLDPTNLLDAVELGGKLFIADHATMKFSETGCVIDNDGEGAGTSTGRVLDKGGVVWSAIDVDNDLCYIKDAGTGGPPEGCYAIASVGGSGVTATLENAMTAVQATGVEVRIGRAPKVYNPATGAIAIWNQTIVGGVPTGVMPLGCPLITLFQGRIFLAGSDENPHVWQCSRTLDPYDWDFAAEDAARAVIGTSDQYGQIAQPLTALVPYLDDYLIFGCRSELWVLRGNPGDGVGVLSLSQGVGIIGKRAWCHTPTGHLVFLAEDGLYAIAPNAASRPEPISRVRLPRSLIGVNTTTHDPVLAWEPEQNGVCVFLVPKTQNKSAKSTAEHWFFDWDRQAFWKDAFYGAHEPASVLQYRPQSLGRNVLLLGQRNGKIGRFSTDVGSDYGASLEANVLVGPLRMGNDEESFGIVDNVAGILGESSGDVTWTLHSGDNAENAYDAYVAGTASGTGTWSAGRNFVRYPRRRGVAMYMNIASTGTTPWEWDSVLVNYRPGGRYR